MKDREFYHRQYWRLAVIVREVEANIEYAYHADPYFDESDWYGDFDYLGKCQRLKQFALDKLHGDASPMPVDFGSAQWIYDLSFK